MPAAMHRLDPAYIRALARRVFGDPAKAGAWLRRPSVQLGGRAPLAVLGSEDGLRRVAELLTQIDDDDRLKID